MPTFVCNNNIFSNIDNEENIVSIKSIYNNKNIIIGKGVGKYPTAASIVKNIISICNNNKYNIIQQYNFKSMFFVIIICNDIKNNYYIYI